MILSLNQIIVNWASPQAQLRNVEKLGKEVGRSLEEVTQFP